MSIMPSIFVIFMPSKYMTTVMMIVATTPAAIAQPQQMLQQDLHSLFEVDSFMSFKLRGFRV